MTTRVTVDAHAGWPVLVVSIVGEENDGSATFIKNRMPLPGKGQSHYTSEEYVEWKQQLADYETYRKELRVQNEKALAAAKKRGYTVDPRITEAGIQ